MGSTGAYSSDEKSAPWEGSLSPVQVSDRETAIQVSHCSLLIIVI